MAMINAALIAALSTGYRRDFQAGVASAKAATKWSRVATEVPSSAASNTYGWLGQFPTLREWVGERVVKSMKAHAYKIDNKTFEATVGVKREDIEDDNVGIYSPLMQEMGYASAIFVDQLLWPLLAAGHSTLCYDGQNFFDTDHPVYANQDGTGAVSSVSNVTAGAGTPWFVLCTRRALKPMIVQMRRRPQFVSKTAQEQSDHVFLKNEYLWGTDQRVNVGFGLWQFARRSQATLTPDALFAEVAAMEGLKADGGRPLGLTPDLLVVPPSLRAAAYTAVKAQQNANGASNIAFGMMDVEVVEWLA